LVIAILGIGQFVFEADDSTQIGFRTGGCLPDSPGGLPSMRAQRPAMAPDGPMFTFSRIAKS